MMRKLLVGGLAAVAVLVLVAVAAAALIDVDQLRPAIEHVLESAAGRKVSFGGIRLSLLTGSVSVDNVSIADDPKFGAAPFVTAKTVKVAVDMWPLIVSRSVHVQAFTLEQPHIAVRRASSGSWNFSSIGAQSFTSSGASAPAKSAAPDVAIGKLVISDGQVTVVSPGARGKDRVYTDVNIAANDLSYTSQFPFRLDAKTPGGGTVRMNGKAGPLDADDVSTTPIEAKLQVKQFDLAASGFVDPASGLGGLVDFNGTLTSNGREAVSKGTLSANKLRLVPGSSPARVPVTIGYRSSYDLKRRTGTIAESDVHIGRALAGLSGSFRTDADATSVRLKIAGHGMPVPELEASLAAVGVTLPSGASLETGTLDVDLNVSGPIERLTTAGPVKMSNAKLKGFDLASSMAAVEAFAGIARSPDTRIETLSATVKVAPDGIRVDALELIVAGIGRLTGSGTIAPTGALAFKMVAELSGSAGLAGTVSRVTSIGGTQTGVPFLVSGTTSHPRFAPDVTGVVRKIVNQENATKAATGLLKGIFKK